MFEAEQSLFAERIQEVRVLHQAISELESTDPLQPDPNRVLVLRELFFVLLYGCFEVTVNQLVSAALREISGSGVKTRHLEAALFSLALDPQLTSVESGASRGKWKRRIELFDVQAAEDACLVKDSILAMYLQNIGRESLEQVFRCFGIMQSVVPSSRQSGYLDELVEKRRAVSHGRSSAEEVGRAFRSPELSLRITAVTEVIGHLQGVFTTYIDQKMFVADPYR